MRAVVMGGIGLWMVAAMVGAQDLRAFRPGNSMAVEPVPFRFLRWGDHPDRIRTRQVLAARNQQEFENLWRDIYFSRGPLPRVDWNSYQVVGVFAGEKPTEGYALQVRGAVRAAGTVFLEVAVLEPPVGSYPSSLESNPFALIVLEGHEPVRVSWMDMPQAPAPGYSILDAGDQVDSVIDGGVLTFRNQRDLERVWNDIHGGKLTPPPVPHPDFSRNQIVVIFPGPRQRMGYQIQVVAMRELRDSYELVLHLEPPDSTGAESGGRGFPYLVLALDGRKPPRVRWQ